MRLSLNDYKSILKYYNIDIVGMKVGIIKSKAEAILAEKLCRCIKTVNNYKKKNTETKAIAVCKNSVLTRKNLKIVKFTCKKSAKFLQRKQGKQSKQSKQGKQGKQSRQNRQNRLSKTVRKLHI
jgi:hypothetical protein